jgi:hypothetical protein
MTSEVFTAVKMWIVFWVVMLSNVVDNYRLLKENYCLHLRGRSEDGSNMFHLNSRNQLQDNTMSLSRRPQFIILM